MTALKKGRIPKVLKGAVLAGFVSLYACSTGTPERKRIEETAPEEFTQGIVTEVEEVKKDLFKIADETIVPAKEDSRIIAKYIDGGVDTFTLDEVRLTDVEDDGSESYRHRSSMGGIVAGGLMGYFMGRSMSSSLNPNAYKNPAAYQKSTTTTANALRPSAKTTTTRNKRATRPSGSSGYGKNKSTRSYGG